MSATAESRRFKRPVYSYEKKSEGALSRPYYETLLGNEVKEVHIF